MSFSKFFNPKTSIIEFRIQVSLDLADRTGWEFSDLYEECRQHKEAYEDSMKRIRKDWSIEVRIYGPKSSPSTLFCVGSWYNGKIEWGPTKETGDDEQTIKDVIQWLTDGAAEAVKDFSYDKSDKYYPAFAQFNTMS